MFVTGCGFMGETETTQCIVQYEFRFADYIEEWGDGSFNLSYFPSSGVLIGDHGYFPAVANIEPGGSGINVEHFIPLWAIFKKNNGTIDDQTSIHNVNIGFGAMTFYEFPEGDTTICLAIQQDNDIPEWHCFQEEGQTCTPEWEEAIPGFDCLQMEQPTNLKEDHPLFWGEAEEAG